MILSHQKRRSQNISDIRTENYLSLYFIGLNKLFDCSFRVRIVYIGKHRTKFFASTST